MKPIIGVVEWPYTDSDNDKIYEVPSDIVNKISAAGGITVGIFPTQICDFQGTRLSDIPELSVNDKDDLIHALNMCDAIIKPGTTKVYEFDKFIQSYTETKDMPYLGICGGMQLMTYPTGKLANTAPNILVRDINKHKSVEKYAHDIVILRGTRLYNIIGYERIPVNSKHKYAISDPNGCIISAYSDDGVTEAIENPNNTFQIGVQWHPEYLDDIYSDNLFGRFVDEAKTYSLKRK